MNNNNDNTPIVFVTTPTSATASMWRIISTISSGHYKLNRFTDDFYHKGQLEEIQNTSMPLEEKSIILFNTPMFFNFEQKVDKFKYFINVRDPRDLLCNMYHWALVHPEPFENNEEFLERINKVKDIGIDKFVLAKNISSFYSKIIELWSLKESIGLDIEPITYSNLCTDFDTFTANIGKFLNQELTQTILASLEIERVEKLTENKEWIGNHWQGSDILPGRYMQELKASTIEQLNIKYEQEIAFCNLLDGEMI